jgi:iron(III) transport system substrate-binding protein
VALRKIPQIPRNRPTEASSRRGHVRRRSVALAAVACSALAVACLTGASGPALAAKRGASVPLVVYSAQGYDQAMVKAFQHATGIPTKLDTNSTGPLLAQIQASRNNPHWGLLWVDGQTAFAELDDEHMLVRGFEPKVDWNSLGREVLPKDGSFVPTGITFMAAVAYTSKVVKDPPKSWATLLSAKWKGDVGMNTPTQSGPTYPFVAGMMNDLGSIAKGKQYFEKLKANGLVIHTTNGPTLAALASGQIELALVQSSAAIGARHTDPNLRVEYLSPVTMLPSNIGIDAKATKTEISEAERFASFVLTKTGQTVMKNGTPTGDSLYYPVVQGIKARPGLPPLGSVKVQHIDPYVWGPREAAINAWFVSTITK